MRALGLLALLALLWGSGFFWIALSLDGFTPVQLTFARLALGALVLVPIVLVRRLPRPTGRVMWLRLAVSALIANAIPYTLFAVAETTVASSIAGVVNATTPLWTLLIATATRAEDRMTIRRATGVTLGFIGVLVMFEPWNGAPGGTLAGLLACVAAAASYGLSFVYQARYLTNRGIPPLTLTATQLTFAAAFLAVALPFGGPLAAPPTTAIIAILVLGIFGTGAALVLNFTLIEREGATAASVVTYLLPVVALILGIVVRHEPASWTLPLGAGLILAGVGLVRTRTQTARPSPSN